MPLPEADALAALAARRQAGTEFDGGELRRRVDELGDMTLSTALRHDAFSELYAAYAPKGFPLIPYPDDSGITVADHRVRVRAIIVDDAERQVVGEIVRDVVLDHGFVHHELLKVQDAYRGSAISLLLLNQALPIYRGLGLLAVLVHAAMETGRWHWARLGFDFRDEGERAVVLGWAMLALLGLGRSPLPPDAPARRLAQLGTGSPSDEVSMEEVRTAVEAELARWRADPERRAAADALASEWDRRAGVESAGQFAALDPSRISYLAARNRLAVADAIPVGKAIMLSGPDWWGVFDLADEPSQDAFDREFSRRFSGR